MTRDELSHLVSERAHLTPGDSKKVVVALFDPTNGIIATELAAGGDVALVGFGCFTVAQRGPRTGTAPDGTPWTSPVKVVPVFKAGSGLKERVKV